MKKFSYLIVILWLFTQCGKEAIKNESTEALEEPGTEIVKDSKAEANTSEGASQMVGAKPAEDSSLEEGLYGFWVGYFKKANQEDYGKNMYVDEGFVWTRDNKINISIDKIEGNKVLGHSVVAGNDRPFEGAMEEKGGNIYHFEVAEPGDDKYDGKFSFDILMVEGKYYLEGTWEAYKKINISKRKYRLEKKEYSYNPDIMLDQSIDFVDWEAATKQETYTESYGGVDEEFVSTYFVSATRKAYEVNASNKLLTKEEVENLSKGDLMIIRNAIYARHGYSFRARPLRVFFDSQDWYIPVHANIKSQFTDIEKKNIKLLLQYEEHAKEYYDSFGRG